MNVDFVNCDHLNRNGRLATLKKALIRYLEDRGLSDGNLTFTTNSKWSIYGSKYAQGIFPKKIVVNGVEILIQAGSNDTNTKAVIRVEGISHADLLKIMMSDPVTENPAHSNGNTPSTHNSGEPLIPENIAPIRDFRANTIACDLVLLAIAESPEGCLQSESIRQHVRDLYERQDLNAHQAGGWITSVVRDGLLEKTSLSRYKITQSGLVRLNGQVNAKNPTTTTNGVFATAPAEIQDMIPISASSVSLEDLLAQVELKATGGVTNAELEEAESEIHNLEAGIRDLEEQLKQAHLHLTKISNQRLEGAANAKLALEGILKKIGG